jgi:hypothetical protein
MEKQKRKNQPYHQTVKLHRAQEFDFTVALSLEECIERIQQLSHKAKRFTVETDVMVTVIDSLSDDARYIHVCWGADMPVHVESALTLMHIDGSTTRIKGRIGVVKRAWWIYVNFLCTWIGAASNNIQRSGLTLDAVFILGSLLLTILVPLYILFSILTRTRPIETRLESMRYAFENDEKLKRAVQQLEIEEAITTANTEISQVKEAIKRPNHVPR